MKTIGVIPARWASKRFPGKVLADLNGKPLIQHVWERACQATTLSEVWIACDHPDVARVAQDFGAVVVMTDPGHQSGTDRIAEAVQQSDAQVIINIQGDEPQVDPSLIDDLAACFSEDPQLSMATVISVIADPEAVTDPNVVKVVVDRDGYALYFSRSPIPYNRDAVDVTYFRHIGLYAYQKDFLLAYARMKPSSLERAECLEQLRVLQSGRRIKTVMTDKPSWGVDVPADLERLKFQIEKNNV